MKVLVIGSTGKVGSSLVRELRSLGVGVRAFVRTGGDASQLTPEDRSVEIFSGELDDRAKLASALSGCDSVFLTSPHSPEMPELHMNVIAVAKRFGTRVVRLSGWTPSIAGDSRAPGGRSHWLVEQYLANSGLPYTVLHTNYFMQNIGARNAQVIRDLEIFAGPLADARISMIDIDDIAAAAARILACADLDDALYTLTGPAAVSYADVAECLTEMLGREIRYVNMPPEDFRQWMLDSGRKVWEADHALALFAIYRAGLGETVTADIELLTERQPSSLEQYLRRNLSIFSRDHAYAG